MRSPSIRAFSVVALLASSLAVAGERPDLDRVLALLHRVRGFRGVAVSPEGRRVAWVESDGAEARPTTIRIADINSPASARRWTPDRGAATANESDPVWSPDGRRLAFLSDAGSKGQPQAWVVAAAGGKARRLTDVRGDLGDLAWSPDGRSIACLVIENAPRRAGPLVPSTPDSGVVGEKVFEQRLAIVDVATAHLRLLSPPDLYVYEYDWSPDGTMFAATGAHGAGDDNWWVAELYTIDAASGRARSILKPSVQIAAPRFSPDGRSILYIGGIMSDEGSTGGDIYRVPAGGGTPEDLTPGMKASATSLAGWLRNPDRAVFGENVDGDSGLAAVDPASGKIETLWKGAEVISAGRGIGASLSRDGSVSALIRQSFERPPEIWAGPTGDWKQQTRINAGIGPLWGRARSLHWSSGDFQVQGWLLEPPRIDRQKRFPMVVLVHGGPAAANTAGWPGRWSGVLASQGYFVLLPNPRGSYGQGEAFTRANVQDFGYGDFRDILAGVDAAIQAAPVDRDRVGIGGWSYGGYMTMWAVTQTDRFAAAVAGAGIANWQSYYGENRIDQWMIPYFGASVYEDPAVYAKSSPMTFITKVHTPTLILQGDRDAEVPAPQAYEFWHALKTLGVPTELVIYADEGHGVRKPEHQRDIIQRMVGWFDQRLGSNARAAR
jgi:dipeptidyl aminopeptidase/acylaminoacyl peptidase